MRPDIVVHGIRFYWDHDSEQYEAQVTPADIMEVYNAGFDAGVEEYDDHIARDY